MNVRNYVLINYVFPKLCDKLMYKRVLLWFLYHRLEHEKDILNPCVVVYITWVCEYVNVQNFQKITIKILCKKAEKN